MMNGKVNRRDFARRCVGLALVAASGKVINVHAEDLPKLDPAGPQAAALGYVNDAAEADTAKFANFVAGSQCSGCQLYTGAEGDEWGPCTIFPGISVNANGWCSAFVKKV